MDCHEHEQRVPEKFNKPEVSDASKFGRFILQQLYAKEKPAQSDISKRLSSMNKYSLLEDVIVNPSVDIEDLLDTLTSRKETSVRGNLYEAIWDVVIKTDHLSNYTSKTFHHVTNKIEENEFVLENSIDDVVAYLKNSKVITGNKAGVSDIKLREKNVGDESGMWACARKFTGSEAQNFILFSVKYYVKETHLNGYDIQNITEIVERINQKAVSPIQHKIVLLIHNKREFEERVKCTTKEDYMNDVADVFDLQDLLDIVQTMRANPLAVLARVNGARKSKPYLMPRFHQLLFVNMTLNKVCRQVLKEKEGYLVAHGEKQILWGQIARAGKTFTAGMLISKLAEKGFYKHIQRKKERTSVTLVITPAPTETLDQFKKEMFDTFADFDGFQRDVYDRTYNKLPADAFNRQHDAPAILCCSKQFLQGKLGNDGDTDGDMNIDKVNASIEEKCMPLQNKVDLIIFDEIHSGGTTDISRKILDVIDPNNKAIKIFLTATYKKPVLAYKITVDQLMTWGLPEIQTCKFISSPEVREELYDQYGQYFVDGTLNEMKAKNRWTSSELFANIENEYMRFPTIHVLTSQFDIDKLTAISNDNPNAYGFDINSLFEVKRGEPCFINENSIHNILDYIGDTNNPRSINSRILKTCHDYSQRRPFVSQLWFLPFFQGNPIKLIAEATENMVRKHEHFKEYEVVRIVEHNQNKDTIKKAEIVAMREGKKGLIILVGKKFSLGVSLPCVDAVFFLNNDTEVDVIYQRMFRSLTESTDKSIGFVVDLNPYRSISALLDYSTKSEIRTGEAQFNAFKRIMKNRTIYIDDDLLQITRKDAPTMEDLYRSVKEYIKKNFPQKHVEDVKQQFEQIMMQQFTAFIASSTLIDIFSSKKNKKTGVAPIALIEATKTLAKGHQPLNASNSGKEPSSASNEKKVEVKKPSNQTIINISTNITMAWRDIVVIFAFMMMNEAGNLVNLSFEELLGQMYEANRNSKTCEEGKDDDRLTLDP